MDDVQAIAGSDVAWANHTTLNPIGLAAVVLLGILMLALPRRYAMAPMFIMACFVAPAQRVVLFGCDFDMLRLMVLFGWLRLFVRGELRPLRWRPLDYALVAWLVVGTLAYTALYQSGSAFVNRLGWVYDGAGMYFLFRQMVRSTADVESVAWTCVWLSIPVSVFFVVEKSTGHNVFAIFGGVPAMTMVREGSLRCQGAFAHPILAGCFWASLLPLMVALCWRKGAPVYAVVAAVVASLVIIVMCASSTPVMQVLLAILGAGMFLIRPWMYLVRWGSLILIVGLHLSMKKPVWHLLSRVDVVSGSTGWHRYYLVDQAVNHFGDWALIGTVTTGDWGLGLQDVTNQYVLEGVRGGVLALFFFVLGIALAFRSLGRTLRAARNDKAALVLTWALGVSLAGHCFNFIAVSYFGQIIMVWFLTLAAIASLDPVPATRAPVRTPAREHKPWEPAAQQPVGPETPA